jgi:SnoaL-like domain
MSHEDVRANILAVVHNIDARQWKEIQELFAPTVFVDYTSLFGGVASQTNASELVGGWRTVLDGVITQHLLSPIDVRLTASGADNTVSLWCPG